jgi:hypothetical protein
MKSREHDAQAAVIRWARSMELVEPRLRLLFAIPNAAKRSPGLAAIMKAEGLRAGVPDLCLPVPRLDHGIASAWWEHGLFVEMKIRPNRVTEAQQGWIEALRGQRYRVEICWSALEAVNVIKYYLGIR